MSQLRHDELTLERIQEFLDAGHVLTGPGSDQHDTEFYCEDGKYVYHVIGYGSMDSYQRTFPATTEGLFSMLISACFKGSHYHPKEED